MYARGNAVKDTSPSEKGSHQCSCQMPLATCRVTSCLSLALGCHISQVVQVYPNSLYTHSTITQPRNRFASNPCLTCPCDILEVCLMTPQELAYWSQVLALNRRRWDAAVVNWAAEGFQNYTKCCQTCLRTMAWQHLPLILVAGCCYDANLFREINGTENVYAHQHTCIVKTTLYRDIFFGLLW